MGQFDFQSEEMAQLFANRGNRREERRQLQIQKMRARRGRFTIAFLLVLVMLVCGGADMERGEATLVSINIVDTTMTAGEELPQPTIEVHVDGNKSTLLEPNHNYTIHNLMLDLIDNAGMEYHYNTDGKVDGTYLLDGQLNKALRDKLLASWFGKVNIRITDGNLIVKNTKGRWEDDVFVGWDENPIKNTWITHGGQKILLDDNAKMTVGTQQIGIIKYKFDNQGNIISQETNIDPDKPMIAITMDDGPGKYTDEVLDILEENGAHGTFFMQGANVKEVYADVLKRMVDIGCELGNHSTNHLNLTELTPKEVQAEVKKTDKVIKKYTGQYPTVLRPPYGAVNEEVLQSIELPVILWNVDTLDWKTRDVNKTVKSMTTDIKDGDILLLHDIHKPSVEALRIAVPELVKQGYQLVTVSELKETQGEKLTPGKKYYSGR